MPSFDIELLQTKILTQKEIEALLKPKESVKAFCFDKNLKFGCGKPWLKILENDFRVTVDYYPKNRFKFALIDFDGVLIESGNSWIPAAWNQGMEEVLLYLVEKNIIPVLWTARTGEALKIAYNFLWKKQQPLITIERYKEITQHYGQKPLVDMIIDDLAIGLDIRFGKNSNDYGIVDAVILKEKVKAYVERRGWKNEFGN